MQWEETVLPRKSLMVFLYHNSDKTSLYKIFGDKEKIDEFIKKYPIKQNYKLFDTKKKNI